MPQIKAKPTELEGVLYRSRTEARWAVYFGTTDVYPTSKTVVYEPEGVFEDYVPDFLVAYIMFKGVVANEIWEIKPKVPSKLYQTEWLERSRSIVGRATCQGLHIFTHSFLAVGDFYQGERPYFAHVDQDGQLDFRELCGSIEQASEWRFDLDD